jgi:hypothetical protein
MINERRFSLDEAKYTIESEGFDFTQLQALFPFGFLGIREGEYVELVEMALDSLTTPDDQTLLMDLLDMQWYVYCEQLGFASDRSDDSNSFREHARATHCVLASPGQPTSNRAASESATARPARVGNT